MALIDRVADGVRRASLGALTIVVVVAVWSGPPPRAAAAQAPGTSGVQIVHGIADAGPLDVYIDGSLAFIGIVFGDTSDEIALAGGERHFSVTPTGSGPDAALVSGPITLAADARYYITLLGSGAEASVGLFRIENRPLEAGQARFRVINGVPDAGELVPFFTGGDPLSQPLAFGDVTEYATLEAGTYDLDVLDNISGAVLLSLPQTPFAEGAATDIFLVGLLADGTMQALVTTVPVETTRPAGLAAVIAAGTCAEPGELVAELGVVQPGFGEEVGVGDVPPIAQGFGQAAVLFDNLLAAPHAIVIEAGVAGDVDVAACGNIGGRLTETGALIVPLQEAGSDQLAGVAVLAPGLDDPETTGVSVFVTTGAALPTVATPTVSG